MTDIARMMAHVDALDVSALGAWLDALLASGDAASIDAAANALGKPRPGISPYAARSPHNLQQWALFVLRARAPAGSATATARSRYTWVNLDAPDGMELPVDAEDVVAHDAAMSVRLRHVVVRRPEAFARLSPSVRSLGLEHVRGIDSLSLGALPAHADVIVRGHATPLRLALPPRLAALTLREVQDVRIEGDVALGRLDVDGDALARLPAGRITADQLVVASHPNDLDGLASVGSVTKLHLSGSFTGSLAPLASLPRLAELALEPDVAVDLAGLAGCASLRIVRAQSRRAAPLVCTAPLPGVAHLETGGSHLGPLDVLAAFPGLRHLSLRTLELPSLGGVERCTALETLVVDIAPTLHDVSALAGLGQLTTVSFLRCPALSDLTPLAGLTSLRVLQVVKTRVTKTRIPASLHPVVQPQTLVAKRAPRKRAAALPQAATGSLRVPVARLKKMLLSRDAARIDQAIELARGLGDPAVFESLVGGTRAGRRQVEASQRRSLTYRGIAVEHDVLVPNGLFEHGPSVRAFRERALWGLVAAAPDTPELLTLRATPKHVLFQGGTRRWGAGTPVDLAPLARFPNVEAIDVHAGVPVRGFAALSGLKLRSLVLTGSAPEGLAALESATLTRLDITDLRASDTLGPGVRFPALTHLRIEGYSARIEHGGSSLPALEELRLRELPAGARWIADAPKLRVLDLLLGAPPPEIAECPLERVSLREAGSDTLGHLVRRGTLRLLVLSGLHPAADLGVLEPVARQLALEVNHAQLSNAQCAQLARLTFARLSLVGCRYDGGAPPDALAPHARKR